MLHFAYGSNMHRAVMRKHAPSAVPLGVARLEGYRFIITADGYASVAPQPRACVHGLLWRLTARDRVTLDLWENIAGGMYRAAMLPIVHANSPGLNFPRLNSPRLRCPAPRACFGSQRCKEPM